MSTIQVAEMAVEQAWARLIQTFDSPVLFLLAMDAHAEACHTRNLVAALRAND